MKTKIINILYHPPAYEAYRDKPRPEVNWDTPDGNWVGIWGYDWPDLLGNEVLKITDEFDYEVWQPDVRADKIYSHQFENGLVHKLFPANDAKERWGFKTRNYQDLSLMKKQLRNEDKFILHINTPISNNNKIFINIPEPKLFQYHSLIKTPYTELKKVRPNFLTYIYLLKEFFLWRRIKTIFHVYNNSHKHQTLKYLHSLGANRIFMGCDFDYWVPGDKELAKGNFGIDSDVVVISFASRLNKLKQIDKVIEIFKDEKFRNYKFKILIAGHGNKEYENYIQQMAQELIHQGKLEFVGYLRGKDMLNLYKASDLFISSSTFEGGPVSVMKALACEVPVMCTRVGGVDDILAENNTGLLVDPFDYTEWKQKLVDFLEGKQVQVLDREIAKKFFHWPNIARQFIEIYRRLENA